MHPVSAITKFYSTILFGNQLRILAQCFLFRESLGSCIRQPVNREGSFRCPSNLPASHRASFFRGKLLVWSFVSLCIASSSRTCYEDTETSGRGSTLLSLLHSEERLLLCCQLTAWDKGKGRKRRWGAEVSQKMRSLSQLASICHMLCTWRI